MTEHMWIRARLRAYSEGDLAGETRDRVASHLDRCAGCAEAARRMSSFAQGLRAARPEVEPLSEGQADRILDHVLASPAPRAVPGARLGALGAATAVVVLALLWAGSGWQRGAVRPPVQPARLAAMPAPPHTGGRTTASGTGPAQKANPGERVAAAPAQRHPGLVGAAVPRRNKGQHGSGGGSHGQAPVISVARRTPGADPEVRTTGSRDGADPWMAAPGAVDGQVLVVAVTAPAADVRPVGVQVTVTRSAEDAPGYARAVALIPNGRGSTLMRESAVSTAAAQRTAVSNTVALDTRGQEQSVLRVAAEMRRQGELP